VERPYTPVRLPAARGLAAAGMAALRETNPGFTWHTLGELPGLLGHHRHRHSRRLSAAHRKRARHRGRLTARSPTPLGDPTPCPGPVGSFRRSYGSPRPAGAGSGQQAHGGRGSAGRIAPQMGNVSMRNSHPPVHAQLPVAAGCSISACALKVRTDAENLCPRGDLNPHALYGH
jgi:hypothetical protein